MTLTERLLLRYCSIEVQAMLNRLRERPEDFNYEKRLYDLISHQKHYTWVENKCTVAAWKSHERNEGRRHLLNAIMSELINPTKKY